MFLNGIGIGRWIPSLVVIRSSPVILKKQINLCALVNFMLWGSLPVWTCLHKYKSMCRILNCCHTRSCYQGSRCTCTNVCCFFYAKRILYEYIVCLAAPMCHDCVSCESLPHRADKSIVHVIWKHLDVTIRKHVNVWMWMHLDVCVPSMAAPRTCCANNHSHAISSIYVFRIWFMLHIQFRHHHMNKVEI